MNLSAFRLVRLSDAELIATKAAYDSLKAEHGASLPRVLERMANSDETMYGTQMLSLGAADRYKIAKRLKGYALMHQWHKGTAKPPEPANPFMRLSAFEEKKHPRGQPGNAGEFVSQKDKVEPKSKLSDDELAKMVKRRPLPLPPHDGIEERRLKEAWGEVSRLWPAMAEKVSRITEGNTPTEACINPKTGVLTLQAGTDLRSEVLWHELVHLSQAETTGNPGRRAESDAQDRSDDAKELLDRFRQLDTVYLFGDDGGSMGGMDTSSAAGTVTLSAASGADGLQTHLSQPQPRLSLADKADAAHEDKAQLRWHVFAAMIDAAEEALQAGDKEKYQDIMDALATLGSDAGLVHLQKMLAEQQHMSLMAQFDDSGIIAEGLELLGWIRGTSRSGHTKWTNTDTKEIRYQEVEPGHRERRRQKAAVAHGHLERLRNYDDLTKDHLDELADNLHALTVKRLQNVRMWMGSRDVGGGRLHKGLVDAIKNYAVKLVDRNRQRGENWEQEMEQVRAMPPKPAYGTEEWKAQQKAKTPKQQAEQNGVRPLTPQAGKVYNVPLSGLHVDPERFQFKLNTDKESGTGQELKSVKKFNPELAGVVSIWRDPEDGKDYIVNGHHRFELADRTGHPSMNVQYIQAKNAAEARGKGAFINIAEGRGTPVDAAKFMRDTGKTPQDFEAEGISLSGPVARDAGVLSQLSPGLFNRLATGRLEMDRALAIGRELKDPNLQDQLYREIEKREDSTGKEISPKIVQEMAREIAQTPLAEGEDSGDLFAGMSDVKLARFVERAELKSYIRAELAKEQGDFAAVSSERRAANVGRTGNVLDVEANKKEAADAERAKNTYNTLVNLKGPVSEAINSHVEEYANAKSTKQRNEVKQRALGAVRSALSEAQSGAVSPVGEGIAAAHPEPAAAGEPGGRPAPAAAAPGTPAEVKANPEQPAISNEKAREIMRTIPTPKELPEKHDTYFTSTAKTVPLDKIKPIRARPEGIEHAAKFMAGAASGQLPKRAPIKVVNNGDGTYDVADGNSTFANAKKFGWKSIPVEEVSREWMEQERKRTAEAEAVNAHQKIAAAITPEERNLPKTIAAAYANQQEAFKKAAEAKPVFDTIIDTGKGIDKALGATAIRPNNGREMLDALRKPGPLVIVGKLKGAERAAEKVEADYGGDWSRLHDLVRATVAVDHVHDIPGALEALRGKLAENGWELAKAPKDRFANPTEAGYRDIMLNVKSPDGVVGEVQVNTKAMMIAKSETGHKLYEQSRSLVANAIKENRPLHDDERAEQARLEEEMKRLYKDAWHQSLGVGYGGPNASESGGGEVLRPERATPETPEPAGVARGDASQRGMEAVPKHEGVLHGGTPDSGAGVSQAGEGVAGENAGETVDHAKAIRDLYDRSGDTSIPKEELDAKLASLDELGKSELLNVAEKMELVGMKSKSAAKIRQDIKQKILDRRSGAQRQAMTEGQSEQSKKAVEEFAKAGKAEAEQPADRSKPVGAADASFEQELAKLPPDGSTHFVGGFPIKRIDKDTWRLETEKFHVVSNADTVAMRLRRNWADQRPERKAIDEALKRASEREDPNPFEDQEAYERDNAAAQKLPAGARVVSLDPETRGRVGQIVKTEDGGVGVKLDGSPDVTVADFEPLDAKHSWRAGGQGEYQWSESSQVEEIQGGNGRFDDAKTVADIRARLHKGEQIAVHNYRDRGFLQVRVMRPSQSGAFGQTSTPKGIVAVARIPIPKEAPKPETKSLLEGVEAPPEGPKADELADYRDKFKQITKDGSGTIDGYKVERYGLGEYRVHLGKRSFTGTAEQVKRQIDVEKQNAEAKAKALEEQTKAAEAKQAAEDRRAKSIVDQANYKSAEDIDKRLKQLSKDHDFAYETAINDPGKLGRIEAEQRALMAKRGELLAPGGEVPPLPDQWQDTLFKARTAARDLGIPFEPRESLSDLTKKVQAEIDKRNGKQPTMPSEGQSNATDEQKRLESKGGPSEERGLPAGQPVGEDAPAAPGAAIPAAGEGVGAGSQAVLPNDDQRGDGLGGQAGESGNGPGDGAGAGNGSPAAETAGRAGKQRTVGSGRRGGGVDGRSPAIPNPTPAEVSVAQPPTDDNPTDVSAGNFRYDNRDFFKGSPKSKINANLAAIRTLQAIEAEGRDTATPEEQAILSKYVGWGAFPGMFNYYDRDLEKERQALHGVLTSDELDAARRSTLNAHFTHPDVVDAHWKMAERLGFKGGRFLETSAGIGYYLGLMPQNLAAKTRSSAVELDKTTGSILKLLYPKANVKVQGFEKFQSPDGFYDLVASNVPFGDYKLHDPQYNKHQANIHDYFFLKSVDKVRPGGLVMHITSTGTMDKADDHIRQELAKKCDLVSAIRFPGGAHKENAGTEVVTDMLILRRRLPGEEPTGHNWMETTTVPDPAGGEPIPVNRYFAEHPEQILGTLDRTGTMYHGESVNVSKTDDYEQRLQAVIDRLPQGLMKPSTTPQKRIAPEAMPEPGDVKVGGFKVEKGKVYVRDQNGLVEHGEQLSPKDTEKLQSHLTLRDAVRATLNAQLRGEDATEARATLNRVYDDFVKKHGYVNSPANKRLFRSDPDSPVLLALEKWDPKKKKGEKADIFSKDTVRSVAPVEKAGSVHEAVGVSLHERGGVDLDHIAQLTGKPHAQVAKELVESGLAYEDPGEGWKPADQYLSGNVRRKLTLAKAAAETDPKYKANVEALEKVQPEDVDHTDIEARLGAAWVPPTDIAAFAGHLLNGPPDAFNIKHTQASGWLADYNQRAIRHLIMGGQAARDIWQTSRKDFTEILEAALNNTPLLVYDKVGDKSVLNAQETADAQAKAQQMKDAFGEWLWTDDERRQRLHRYYNDNFNNIREMKYDGSHLKFPGMNPSVKLHKHIPDFVWQVVTTGKGLAAHEVGMGKTYAMIASAMELRRLGLARKPAIACLKANVEQITNDAMKLYPGMKVLSTADMFDAEKRKKTISQIATGDYDLVIMTHDHMDLLRMKPDTVKSYINDEIAELEAAKTAAMAEDPKNKNNRAVKALEKAKARLEAKLEEALDVEGKDDAVYFEDTGIDHLFVDEAHKYKSLPVYTKQTMLKGVPNSRSDRATNMQMRSRWLQEQNNGRGVVFATGTPVANTMAELYNMQRYLQPKELKERGIDSFDAWASTFGDVQTKMEITATGEYKPVSRFAKFVNIPELMQTARQVMDVQRIDGMEGSTVIRPKRHDHVVTSPKSESMASLMLSLQDRAKEIKKGGPPQKGADNMLTICTDGRKGALDMRLLDPSAPDDPDSKTNQAIANVLKLHKEKPGATQLIFSDIGVHPTSGSERAGALSHSTTLDQRTAQILSEKHGQPVFVSPGKADDYHFKDGTRLSKADVDAATKRANAESEERVAAANSASDTFHLYGDIIDKLVKGGIPREKIADFSQLEGAKKEAAMEAMRKGEILIGIGSTDKMGTGVNVQNKLAALHHLDVPWLPASVEQRDGRGWRHGNENKDVNIYSYVTEGSLDQMFWQIIGNKQRFISQVVKPSGALERTANDEDTEQLTPDQLMAAASGDPRILEKVQLDEDVRQLKSAEKRHQREQIKFKDSIASTERSIPMLERRAKAIRDDVETLEKNPEFSLTIDGKTYTDRKEAKEAFEAKSAEIDKNTPSYYADRHESTIGEFRGLQWRRRGQKHYLASETQEYSTGGSLASLEAVARKLSKDANSAEMEVKKAKSDVETLKSNVGKDFPKADQLKEKLARVKKLEDELAPKKEEEQAAEIKKLALGQAEAVLVNGWKIRPAKGRVELVGPSFFAPDLMAAGIVKERYGLTGSRFFVPNGSRGITALKNLTKKRPIAKIGGIQ